MKFNINDQYSQYAGRVNITIYYL